MMTQAQFLLNRYHSRADFWGGSARCRPLHYMHCVRAEPHLVRRQVWTLDSITYGLQVTDH